MDLPELFGTTSKRASVLASSHDKKFCLYFIGRIVYQPYAMIGSESGEYLYNTQCVIVVWFIALLFQINSAVTTLNRNGFTLINKKYPTQLRTSP